MKKYYIFETVSRSDDASDRHHFHVEQADWTEMSRSAQDLVVGDGYARYEEAAQVCAVYQEEAEDAWYEENSSSNSNDEEPWDDAGSSDREDFHSDG